jgi:DNA invertase Pin-like site-specific DNA recombinase
MIQFRQGKEVALEVGPRIRYTRKSTEQADRQVASHEQQNAECDQHFGPLPEESSHLWFRDDKSGTTFERPEFQRMIRYCLDNPQTRGPRGRVEVYDHSRWGRAVKKDSRKRIVGVDPKAFHRWIYKLDEVGWDVVFTTESKSDDPLAQILKDGIEIFIAGQKSENLSREVKRGRLDWLRKGRWLGGPPPFPAKRVHPDTGQDLPPGTRVFNGGSVLAVDPTKLPDWMRAAEMYLQGSALNEIAGDFERRGVRNYYSGRMKSGQEPRWTATHIRKILSNPALIGLLEYEHWNEAEQRYESETIKAQWEPLVPVDQFKAVNRKLESEATKVRRRSREGPSTFVVPLMCARCGSYLAGVDVRQPDGRYLRRYRHHASNSAGVSRELAAKMEEAGCQSWSVDADEVEAAILELIAAERGSDEFRERLAALLADDTDWTSDLERKAQDARARAAQAATQQQRTIDLMTSVAGEGLSPQMFVQKLKELQEQQAAALREAEEAEVMQLAASAQRDGITELLDETEAILTSWRTADVADRRAILDWWVDAVLVDFEKVDRKPKGAAQKRSGNVGQRSARQSLMVFLATLPSESGETAQLAPLWTRKRVGNRDWEQATHSWTGVEVRSWPQPQSTAEAGTCLSPNGSAESCHNDESRTVRCAGCTRSAPAGTG